METRYIETSVIKIHLLYKLLINTGICSDLLIASQIFILLVLLLLICLLMSLTVANNYCVIFVEKYLSVV